MSLFIYNGVTFPDCMVTNFRQSAKGDDMSDTDWVLSDFDITFQTTINVNDLSILAPDLAGTALSPADVVRAIYSRLMTRRRQLSLFVNGVNLIPQPQSGSLGKVDAANGPKPIRCDILDLNNLTFLVEYQIQASYWENNSNNATSPIVTNQPGNDVLWNRWSETVEIDHALYTTRKRSGKFIIRSDNKSGFIADQLRAQMAVVGVPPRFLRERSSYTVDPSGLGIAYEVSDKEQHIMPPPRVHKASGEYIEEASRGGGKRTVTCRVSLEGSNLISKAYLIDTAVTVVMSKLKANDVVLNSSKGSSVLEAATLTVDMYENKVSFQARAMTGLGKPTKEGVGGGAFIGPDVAVTPQAGQGLADPPNYPIFGSARRLLQAAAYYDPNLRGTVVNSIAGGTQLSTGQEVGTAGTRKEGGA